MRRRSKIIALLAIAIQSCSEDAFDINNFRDDPVDQDIERNMAGDFIGELQRTKGGVQNL